MADFLEPAGRHRADFARRRIPADQFRKARLDRVVALAQRVIFRVRYARRIVLVVALVVCGDLACETRKLCLGLLFGQIFRVGKIGEFLRHNTHYSKRHGRACRYKSGIPDL